MNQLMLDLLKTLTELDERFGDLTSTDIRETMFDFVWSGFLLPAGDKPERGELYLDDDEIEEEVWVALETYVQKATKEAKAQGLSTFKQRLEAFQADVATEDGMTCDEFFGWVDPDEFDDDGNPA